MSLSNFLDSLDLAYVLISPTATKLLRDKGLYLILLRCKENWGEGEAFESAIPRMGAEDRASAVEGLDGSGSVNRFQPMII